MNSYHHVVEAITIPMSVLLSVETGQVPWLVIAVNDMHSALIHSRTRLNFSPLRISLERQPAALDSPLA